MTAKNSISTRLTYLAGLALLALLGAGCGSPPTPTTAQDYVDAAIERHGGAIINDARIEFDFRDSHFILDRSDGMFSYEKIYTDSLGQEHREIFDNDGTHKVLDGEDMEVDSLMNRRIGTDVNSVAYFTLLPIPLNDPAVVKEDLGTMLMNGIPYRKIGITFRQEGGGRDYQDRFLVWIHETAYTMDYFAYYYFTDETGSRFRQADRIHEVDGIRLADYLNFTYDSLDVRTIDRYDVLFNADSLRLVSEVRLENVTVTRH